MFLIGGVLSLLSAVNRSVSDWLFLVGGTAFTLGSILYWPTFGLARAGVWVFRVGSLCYISGSMILVLRSHPKRTWRVAGLVSYTFGSSLFVVGGIISEAGGGGQLVVASSTVWTIASVFFTIGAVTHLFLAFIQSLHCLL